MLFELVEFALGDFALGNSVPRFGREGIGLRRRDVGLDASLGASLRRLGLGQRGAQKNRVLHFPDQLDHDFAEPAGIDVGVFRFGLADQVAGGL